MTMEHCKYTGAWIVRRKDGGDMDEFGGRLRCFGTRQEARIFMAAA